MLRIVVVEDEYTIRNGLCQLIPRLSSSFQVIGNAANGYDGMQLIRQLQPDIAICDIRMKKTDGLDMIRQLREAKIPCEYIILSGYSEFQYAQKAIQLGVYGYLLKPVVPSELSELLAKAEKELTGDKSSGAETKDSGYSELIRAAVEKIHSSYQSSLSLVSVARELGVTPEYLSSRFTKETGDNFMVYLRNYRIEKACGLLATTNKKMYEIAFLVGYDNPQYFSNVFKSVTGMSPKSWMRKHTHSD